MTMSNAKQLKVTGMTCGHCEIAVRKALQEVPGVVRVVSVDRKKQRAVVEGDPVDQALVDAVADAGYTAELLA